MLQHKEYYLINDYSNIMEKKLLIKFVLFFVLFISSCKTGVNTNSSNLKQDNIDKVEVIKFMGTLGTQPYSVNEKMFWSKKEEHAMLFINDKGFINDVRAIKDTTSTNFEDYKYAFIVKQGKVTDTLYSDYTLKTWILKKDKKKIYFYDEKGETAENLRHMFSFFSDCWQNG